MNQENTMKLVKRFPILYQGCSYGTIQDSGMYFGFQHSDGWFDIIWQLSLAIEDELGYSRWQKKSFLLKKKYSKKWNDFFYKLSPPVQDEHKMMGKGVTGDPYHWVVTKKVYPRDQWLKDLLVRCLPGRSGNFGSTIGHFQRLGIKALVWHPETGYAVSQVKEKFGSLRFYAPGNERINRLIHFAETLSAHTCEQCGAYGETQWVNGWTSTVCKAHSKKEENDVEAK